MADAKASTNVKANENTNTGFATKALTRRVGLIVNTSFKVSNKKNHDSRADNNIKGLRASHK
jgi:hypothetical protein